MITTSSPYNNTFPQKSISSVKDTADNMDISRLVSIILNIASSPYNNTFPQKDKNMEIPNFKENHIIKTPALQMFGKNTNKNP
ncbi:MAG: hypothetical protein B6D64_14280 [Bacteroidetes bacterium 4484_276]|nr:MAG: hypothetical protein B6D64_14280 [Bacteroidetes bacterium 4484_276]OYT13035.1 MAG: hypothetical protein B6I19_07185 [Bacteroidetes bacterium 4572_114]